MKKIKTVIICGVTLALLMASCSKGKYDSIGGSGGTSASSSRLINDMMPAPQSSEYWAENNAVPSYAPMPDVDEFYGEADIELKYADTSRAPAIDNGGPAETRPLMYIKTAAISLGLKAENFDADFNYIKNIVEDSGGFFERSNMNTAQTADKNKNTHTFRLFNATIRVPAENYEYVKNVLDNTGVLYNSSESTQEVSAEYFNTQSRLETCKAEKARLIEIIEQEDNMRRIVEYESRLNEVSTRIEIYESQLRRVQEQVSYSTITLDIRELLPDFEEKEPDKPAFWERLSKTFKGSAESTLAFFQGLLVFIAYVGVPLIVIAALCLVGILVYKRAKRAV